MTANAMTNDEAERTACPLAQPDPGQYYRACRGSDCQLWIADDSGKGRCAHVINALALTTLGLSVGDAVFNALTSARDRG